MLTSEQPVIEGFPGTYKLKFGQQYEEDIVVGAGEEIVIE